MLGQLTKWQSIKRFVFDFTVVFVTFAAAAGLFRVSESHAFPAPVPLELVAPAHQQGQLGGVAVIDVAAKVRGDEKLAVSSLYAAAARGPTFAAMRSDETAILVVLAFAIASIAALNLALLRHVRQVVTAGRRIRIAVPR